jgi:hypothetical protein
MKLTEREIFTLAFNRNLSDNLLKPHQIEASRVAWVDDYLPEKFFKAVKTSPADYSDLIEDYIKPVWAFGCVHNNFEHISLNITDKGVVLMLIEGTAALTDQAGRTNAKAELKQTVFHLLRRLENYCYEQKELNNPLFSDFTGLQLLAQSAIFKGRNQFNQIRY